MEESHLSQGENDDTFLLAELYRMAEGCGLRLRRMGKKASCQDLTLIYSDGLSARRTAMISAPTDDDLTLFAAVRDLFWKTCGRRVGIRSLRLVCGGFKEPDPQMDLFTHTDPTTTGASRSDSLQGTIDRVRERFGTNAVRWGRSIPQVQSPPRQARGPEQSRRAESRVQRGKTIQSTRSKDQRNSPESIYLRQGYGGQGVQKNCERQTSNVRPQTSNAKQ